MPIVDDAAALFLIRRTPLFQRVRAALLQWLQGDNPAMPPVVLACSGGPDSTALMAAVWALQTEQELTVHVVSVDHQLRPQSAAEAEAVCAVARRWGLSAERVAVVCPPGASKMATARTARYAALARSAERIRAQAILVAHTQEDQTETMLMRWLGGAGLRGLAGMEPLRELPMPPGPPAKPLVILRPLLTTARAEVEELLLQIAALVAPLPVHDPSNADRHYQRSRLRHEVLPRLRQEQPQLDARMEQLSAQLRADADYLDAQADAAFAALCRPGETGADPAVRLPVAATAALPAALFARVMMRASSAVLGQVHIAALTTLCAHQEGTRWLDLPGGWRAERRYTELWFVRQGADSRSRNAAEHLIPACGRYVLPQGTLSLHWENEPTPWPGPLDASHSQPGPPRAGSDPQTRGVAEALLTLPAEGFPLLVRSPRPGDRIRLTPAGGHRKVSELLIDLKVSRPARADTLLLCSGNRILWVIGHRLAALPETPATPERTEREPSLTSPRRLRARFRLGG